MSKQFEELGYTKKTCEKCGKSFWSIADRKTCGDAPCDKYEFIGNPATSHKYDLYSIQKEFTTFFEENNHTYIPRYPVLAKRWRDDVFLVGASIYNFQPWVTSGKVDPPANPLVVAQPSIRLNDVDNVGRTGRHMTCFTMGGHHAFNSPGNQVYWEEETIKYCHDFLKKVGINTNEISYIESWWEGGGNAGPCYEICVRGVELATLVFIKYRTLPGGGLEEIPLQIVDTGYGLERFAWISQGTATAYEASFGRVITQLEDIAGVNIDKKILAENAQVAGMMDITDISDLKTLRMRVAERLGISLDELKLSAEPMEAIYIIADHTRCLGFMLADGVIPSNVKEGYLARLLIRRTIRFMRELELQINLKDIMDIQLEFLSKTYPEIRSHKEHIHNIISLEEKRYHKTTSKGKSLVKKSIRYLQKNNKTEMPTDMLIKLYDSHGIPPEEVELLASEMNYSVKVPDNFYTQVAELHSQEEVEEEEEVELDFPPTKLLFYDHPHQTKFLAEILGLIDNNIILDQTLFYPEGGGQPSDIGNIACEEENIRILHAEKIGDVVLHRIAEDDVKKLMSHVGKTVEGEIEWPRRLQLARNHTATHLILSSARKVLGDHIWQAGAQKGIERSRLDLSHYKRISPQELEKIELMANEYVMQNIPLEIRWMDRNEAEQKYGFTLYQGGVVPGSSIRVVNIKGVDVQACAGTHVDYTGEVGMIKINRTERIQDGVERLDFSAGTAAIYSMQEDINLLKKSASIFKVEPVQLPKTCERFFKEWKAFKNDLRRLETEIAQIKMEGLKSKIHKIGNLNVLCEKIHAEIGEMTKIASSLTEKGEDADIVILGNDEGKIVGGASTTALEAGVKINMLINEAARIMGGGGGGRSNLAQGAGKDKDKLEEAMEFIKNSIQRISRET